MDTATLDSVASAPSAETAVQRPISSPVLPPLSAVEADLGIDPAMGGVTLPPRKPVFGIPVSVTHYDEVVDCVISLAKQGVRGSVQFLSAHGLVLATRDDTFAKAASHFSITCPDGQPVRWAINRYHNAGLTDRCYGPETTLRTMAAAEREGVSVYLYGGKSDELLDQLVGELAKRFPKLKIAGRQSPPFRQLSDEEHNEVAREINASGAGICFIGLGCPKQEMFCDRHRDDVKPVMMAVGAAFDFIAGNTPQAPAWMQKRGLEWFYRLCTEPRRLFKRYAVTNSRFLWLWFTNRPGRAD
ncbi:MAG: WecB/TagA/CpsF family glycosyltransferase [Planctomycetota bacterium]